MKIINILLGLTTIIAASYTFYLMLLYDSGKIKLLYVALSAIFTIMLFLIKLIISED